MYRHALAYTKRVRTRGGRTDEPGAEPPAPTRREFLVYTGRALALFLAGVAGCDRAPLDAPAPLVPPAAEGPSWNTIPDQAWTPGVPVHLDLSDYCTAPDRELTFALDRPLPAGISLDGSIISGTPTGPFPPAKFVALADDGASRSHHR
jgi:hypothetical protein